MALVPVMKDVKRPNAVVLVKRSEGSALAGKWCLPAGFVNEHEDPGDAAVREAKEEAGIDTDIVKPIGVIISKDRNRLIHAFMLCLKNNKVNPVVTAGSDAPEAGIFMKHELPPIAYPIHEKIIVDFFSRYYFIRRPGSWPTGW